MRGDPAESGRVFVVHLAAQDVSAPGVVLGGRDAREQRRRGQVRRVLHAERLEQPRARERVDVLPGHALQDLAEQQHAEVAVDGLGARLVDEVHGQDALEVGVFALQVLVEGRPPVDAGRMGQQVPDRDLVLGPAVELGQERGDGLVDVELALVHQDHGHRRGDDDLGEAGQVVHRVRADGSRIVGTSSRTHSCRSSSDDSKYSRFRLLVTEARFVKATHDGLLGQGHTELRANHLNQTPRRPKSVS